MNIPDRSLAFGCVGLVVMLWVAFSLWLGEVPRRRGGINRSSDPFQFWGLIFGYAVIATLLIGAAVIFWVYPHAGLHVIVPED
ncbi:MAG TPA: hypothetical protein VMU04_11600 [Candidatus Acidoferrum sp.]|nr:hypothetical protein [Candidatus Acidoferrum sp.]